MPEPDWPRVERRLRRMGKQGFAPAADLYAKLKAAELEDDPDAAKKEVFRRWNEEVLRPVIDALIPAYETLSEATLENTGMRLEDFAWLMRLWPEEHEEGR